MAKSSIAVVQVAVGKHELQEFPVPVIGPDDGLLRVERCGICGSDVAQFKGEFSWLTYPVIPGHEPIGVIEEVGERAAERWGVRIGDRVVLESAVPCRSCRYCASGEYTSCPNRYNIGFTSTDVEPSLLGGYAQYLYLHPNTSVHKISKNVPLDIAALYNPLTCGVSWAAEAPNTQLGDTMVVMGCGQRGLACVAAAKAAGASMVIITGRGDDHYKLSAALRLGADHVINIDEEDVIDRVRELTDDEGVDTVIDVVPYATQTFVEAIEVVRTGGTVILAGLKGDKTVESFMTDRILLKAVTIKGVLGKGSDSFRRAIQLMESGSLPLESLHTHTFPLEDAAEAIQTLSGEIEGEQAICVDLAP